MAEAKPPQEFSRVPFCRLFLEDIMLLLFLGVAIYAVSYLIWGIMEVGLLPPFPEELKQQVFVKQFQLQALLLVQVCLIPWRSYQWAARRCKAHCGAHEQKTGLKCRKVWCTHSIGQF